MNKQSAFYRIVQPDDERLLCSVDYEADVIVCPANPLHQRSGRRVSGLKVSFPDEVLAHRFCYSWGAEYFVSKRVAEELLLAGLTGFDVHEIEISNNKSNLTDFVEFRVGWNGEFARSRENTVLVDFCKTCGLLKFNVSGDPPWASSDLSSEYDFFILSPFNSVFCSDRANSVMKKVCGSEFVTVPAMGGLGYDVPISSCSMSWPPINPPLMNSSLDRVWQEIRVVDGFNLLDDRWVDR